MPSSTKWRINITAASGSFSAAIQQLSMYAAGSLTDLCTGGTATASSEYSGSYSAAKAFDGNSSTDWMTNTAKPQWIQYEFAAAQSVVAIAITASVYASLIDFTLDYWDGAAWVTVLTVAGEGDWSTNAVRTYSAVSQQMWRLYVSASGSGLVVQIAEMEMHLTAGGANECAGGILSCKDFNTGQPASLAMDADSATVWQDYIATPTWLAYMFPGALNIVEFKIQAPPTPSEGYAPKTFKLQYNDGAGGWTDYDAEANVANWTAGEVRTYPAVIPDTEAPTPGAVTVTGTDSDKLTINVGAGSDNVGVTSRTLRVYSDAGRTTQVGSDVEATVGDNVVTGLSAATTYYVRVVYADAAANTANADATGATLGAAQARVDQLFADVADFEPSAAEIHGLELHIADGGDSAAEVHDLWAEIARGGDSQVEVTFLALEIACRTADLPLIPVPVLKRLDLEAGTWDGSRRRWEVRMHRKQLDGTWKRLTLPSWAVTSVQFTELSAGGQAEATAAFARDWTGALTFHADDRLSVWVRPDAEWQEWYRGAVSIVESAAGRPGTVTVTAHGPMRWADRIRVRRRYAMPSNDVANLFARLISDYLDPWCVTNGLPTFIRDVQAVGEEAGTRDFDGSLTDALADCLNGVPGVAWGFDLTDGGLPRVFLYPRPETVEYCVALGKDASAAALNTDWNDLVNAIELTGAESKFPNMLTNGGFEKPTGEAVGLLANPSFEDAPPGNDLQPLHWTRTVGEGSRKAAAQDNVGAVTGGYYLELDTAGEEVLSDFTPEVTAGVYELRVWMARENSLYATPPTFSLEVYDLAETLITSLAIVPTCTLPDGTELTEPDTQAWREYRTAFTLGASARKFKLRIALASGGGTDRGLAVDDVSLFDRTEIAQEGWTLEVGGSTDVLPTYDASPAPQDDYFVRFDLDTTGGTLKYRPEQSFSLREHQEVRFQVQARVSAAMTVRVGVETYDGSTWVDSGTDNAITTTATWVTYHHDVTGGNKTQEARPYISVPASMIGILDIDAAYVFTGHPGADRAFEDGEANLTLWLSTDDAFVQDDTTMPAAVLTSIADHGRRETRVSAPRVRDLAGAQLYAANYFRQHAIPRTPGPLTVLDRLRHYRFDGLVRLTNIPGGQLDTALFAARYTHTFDAAGWRCEVERDIERPNSITLWRDLETKVEDTYQTAKVGIQALQTSQQK